MIQILISIMALAIFSANSCPENFHGGDDINRQGTIDTTIKSRLLSLENKLVPLDLEKIKDWPGLPNPATPHRVSCYKNALYYLLARMPEIDSFLSVDPLDDPQTANVKRKLTALLGAIRSGNGVLAQFMPRKIPQGMLFLIENLNIAMDEHPELKKFGSNCQQDFSELLLGLGAVLKMNKSPTFGAQVTTVRQPKKMGKVVTTKTDVKFVHVLEFPVFLALGKPNKEKNRLTQLYVNQAVENFKGEEIKMNWGSIKNVPHQQRTILTGLPTVLVLCLKRFDFDSLGGTVLLQKQVEFKDHIAFPEFKIDKETIQFDVAKQKDMNATTVVIREGHEAGAGHFRTYIDDEKKWYSMDDDKPIKVIDVKDIQDNIDAGSRLLTQQIYTIVYTKRSLK